MKTLKISGKLEEIFDLRSKDNNAKVQITMTSWTKLENFNLYQNLIYIVKNLFDTTPSSPLPLYHKYVWM